MPTNWVVENYCLLQESGGNILTEQSDYIALQEYNSTDWEEQTSSGSG
tara:strand:+ start:946 stop:1089 length:144 start_codon:yes stop_codon:yes gene_type:complete